jgi:hypothetical protein
MPLPISAAPERPVGSMNLMLRGVAPLLLALWLSSAPAGDQCPAPQPGRFSNPDGGYDFTIPEGLKGYWASPCTIDPDGQCTCMGVHGLTIPLTSEAYLSVFSGYAPWRDDAEDSVSDPAAYISFLRKFDQSAKDAHFSHQHQVQVNGRGGYYLVENFRDPKSGTQMQEILYLFVDHKEVPNEVIISLRARADRINQFKGSFGELLGSMRWLSH